MFSSWCFQAVLCQMKAILWDCMCLGIIMQAISNHASLFSSAAHPQLFCVWHTSSCVIIPTSTPGMVELRSLGSQWCSQRWVQSLEPQYSCTSVNSGFLKDLSVMYSLPWYKAATPTQGQAEQRKDIAKWLFSKGDLQNMENTDFFWKVHRRVDWESFVT